MLSLIPSSHLFPYPSPLLLYSVLHSASTEGFGSLQDYQPLASSRLHTNPSPSSLLLSSSKLCFPSSKDAPIVSLRMVGQEGSIPAPPAVEIFYISCLFHTCRSPEWGHTSSQSKKSGCFFFLLMKRLYFANLKSSGEALKLTDPLSTSSSMTSMLSIGFWHSVYPLWLDTAAGPSFTTSGRVWWLHFWLNPERCFRSREASEEVGDHINTLSQTRLSKEFEGLYGKHHFQVLGDSSCRDDGAFQAGR